MMGYKVAINLLKQVLDRGIEIPKNLKVQIKKETDKYDEKSRIRKI